MTESQVVGSSRTPSPWNLPESRWYRYRRLPWGCHGFLCWPSYFEHRRDTAFSGLLVAIAFHPVVWQYAHRPSGSSVKLTLGRRRKAPRSGMKSPTLEVPLTGGAILWEIVSL